ncbi:histidine triad (HIT) protein [Nautilia profundicola AmH]|uniref:Histidine triad (HIT) protein n=1 Tax=Nautilia profundicola (strain ATCC BAA-1463 / DSM 18972 / AmH) TaxID=598659 RepID=B9L7A0_NAUPA|nr:HIT family protein [Nautilia profundicola]ACM93044.1 histidine triad (HIT) protein [Nautilia profundicola AmH]
MSCPLCNPQNENVIFQNDFIRVILVDEIPGYIRVITQKHIKEFSDLSYEEAVKITLLTKQIEKAIINTLNPDKVNIAMLGNMVPHLHIHIIPRFKNDPWWPGATFCEKQREFDYPVTQKDLNNLITSIKELNGK